MLLFVLFWLYLLSLHRVCTWTYNIVYNWIFLSGYVQYLDSSAATV